MILDAFRWAIVFLAKVLMLYIFAAASYWVLEEAFCVFYPNTFAFGVTFFILFVITFILGAVMFSKPKRF